MTEWRPIPGFEAYQISENGDIRSLYCKQGLREEPFMLKPWNTEKGYRRVGLIKNGKVFLLRVHRLVAITFLQPINRKNEIAHFDGDPQNNNKNNLRWVTSRENYQDRERHGRTNKGKRMSK